MNYRHGAYGEIIPSREKILYSKGGIPVYIGTAPVQRVHNSSDMVNKPILIKNYDEATNFLGCMTSDNFDDFTLSAVAYAHFKNKVKPIGPIVVINVLDPSKHRKKTSEKASITLINGKGYIEEYAVIETVKIEGKERNVDYKLKYTIDGKIEIISIEDKLESPFEVSYTKVDATLVTDDDIIGAYNFETETRTGISCVQTIYDELNIVPAILSAPGWNHKPKVARSLESACHKIGGHWDAICVTDIEPSLKTLDDAIKWKQDQQYNSIRNKPCFPKVKIEDREIWLSILAIVRMQQTDYTNDGIPYETPSNKQIDASGLILGKREIKINAEQGNKLNEVGITTAIFWGGKWVLWGPHMGNYEYGVTSKPEEVFDVNIRTNIYLTNDFQLRNAELVDTPIARNDIDDILNTEQLRLNSLKSEGKILYGNIEFIPDNNPTNDLINGNFVFDTQVTNTPPGKSLTNRVQYTTEGFETFAGGEE
ncbi:phage tail sheath protein FI [Gottschalkia purinilytica]|uniref:Phage tail sheath protein FI n=1 Tax=Gottschalkia purinilytica TaxID=1503 RepID=A0A0L0WAK3_GOTPU|nr:hypothetical protein [Gottschalkia purinilytica]KNF08554.1 phage tail sheath protein FI [Gottschalkia purinilytica]